ncbi:MAG: formylglycine-generating enzyme family protein [Deltaproteobacteria bacterium]|jgi:formylglycine-generating enzyme required for sulfatase activity|nr:formylglycine-generating enzyme family protein [Deltaproteobacteria bacterium]
MRLAFIRLCVLSAFLFGGAITVLAAEKTYTNTIGMEFILIPSGSFTMGADKNFEDAYDDETPPHRVTIAKPFYLGKYEVTQAQWTAVMGSNPSKFKDLNNPVEKVSWLDAQEFIKRLNAMEGHNRYRLPTEAQWEYAARAGSNTTYSFGEEADDLGLYAWYGKNSGKKPHPVGQLKPNGWGLNDMHGNVSEWVQDWWGERYYSYSPVSDPTGPSSGTHRVLRGGNCEFSDKAARSASRGTSPSDHQDMDNGLRLALSLEERAEDAIGASGLVSPPSLRLIFYIPYSNFMAKNSSP